MNDVRYDKERKAFVVVRDGVETLLRGDNESFCVNKKMKRGPQSAPITEEEKKMAGFINDGYKINEAMRLAGLKGWPNAHKDRLVKAGLISDKCFRKEATSRNKVIEYWSMGHNESEIALAMQVSRQYVWKVLKTLKDKGEIEERADGVRVFNRNAKVSS